MDDPRDQTIRDLLVPYCDSSDQNSPSESGIFLGDNTRIISDAEDTRCKTEHPTIIILSLLVRVRVRY